MTMDFKNIYSFNWTRTRLGMARASLLMMSLVLLPLSIAAQDDDTDDDDEVEMAAAKTFKPKQVQYATRTVRGRIVDAATQAPSLAPSCVPPRLTATAC